MNHFENLRKNLRENLENLPENDAWSTLETSIFDQLDRNNRKKKNRFILIFFLTGFAFIMFILHLLFSNQNNVTSNQLLVRQENGENIEVINSNQEINCIDSQKENIKHTLINSSNDNQVYSGINKNHKEILKENELAANIMETLVLETITQNIQTNDLINSTNISEKSYSQDYSEINLTSTNQLSDVYNKLPLLPLLNMSLPEKSTSKIVRNKIIDFRPAIDQNDTTPESKWSVSMAGGINYGIQRGNSIQNYIHNDWGSNIEMKIGRQITKKLGIESGIKIEKIYTRLDKEISFEMPRYLQDTIIAYQYAALSNATTEIRGDTTVYDTVFNHVVHFNSIKNYSIPVSVYYLWGNKKLKFELGIGATFNLKSIAEGRILEANNFNYYNLNNSQYTNKLSLSFDYFFGMRYSITPKYFAGMNLGYQQYFSTWTIDDSQQYWMDNMSLKFKIGVFLK